MLILRSNVTRLSVIISGILVLGRLWSSLSRDPEFTVDAVNVKTDTIIQADSLIDHGSDDADIDPALWSFNDSDPQRHVFFVLRLSATNTGS